jgi:hypothetical protein
MNDELVLFGTQSSNNSSSNLKKFVDSGDVEFIITFLFAILFYIILFGEPGYIADLFEENTPVQENNEEEIITDDNTELVQKELISSSSEDEEGSEKIEYFGSSFSLSPTISKKIIFDEEESDEELFEFRPAEEENKHSYYDKQGYLIKSKEFINAEKWRLSDDE